MTAPTLAKVSVLFARLLFVATALLLPGASSLANDAAPGGIPAYGYEIVRAFPHDPKAFTEGLFYKDGFLYESTGIEGHSSVRKVLLETGQVVQKQDLPAADFGEGIVDWADKLIVLTWRSQLGYVLDFNSFGFRRTFRYTGEGRKPCGKRAGSG